MSEPQITAPKRYKTKPLEEESAEVLAMLRAGQAFREKHHGRAVMIWFVTAFDENGQIVDDGSYMFGYRPVVELHLEKLMDDIDTYNDVYEDKDICEMAGSETVN